MSEGEGDRKIYSISARAEESEEIMSVFTEHMFELTKASRNINRCDVSWNGYGDFQKMESKIIEAYKNGYYGEHEYRPLINLFYVIKREYRQTIDLCEECERISQEIRQKRERTVA